MALTPAVFHVLLALAQGERHGYGIQKDVSEHTGGEVRLGPGTLYGTLQRLMELDWVEESPRPTAAEDERRRYYRLTRAGRRALKGEVERMDALVRTARAHRVVPRGSEK
ncbi:MAG TPA: PadR family transcriptional regulator [Vicinamibacterales bacterium]|jgi:DNA-binding PadR family transcriptional regulator|nr:PadR family transcriptional regulator [Vicinamibacterales bacterium]